MSATPATVALDRAGVSYTSVSYPVPDGDYGDAMVDALGLDAATCGKSLVVELDGRLGIAVVGVDRTCDLKALASLAGAKRAAMAPVADAERATGSVTGGIAPLGHRRRLPVWIDRDLVAGPTVHVSAGRRGLELTLASADLVAVTGATVGPIAAPR